MALTDSCDRILISSSHHIGFSPKRNKKFFFNLLKPHLPRIPRRHQTPSLPGLVTKRKKAAVLLISIHS